MTEELLLTRYAAARAALPLIAILRGIRSDECAAIGTALYDAGFRIIEVPLNSPDPLEGIRALRALLPIDALVGAGTVLSPEEVETAAGAGAEIIISPNSDDRVIARTKALGRLSLPGVATPSEAFAALAAGADGLKLFPAELITPAVVGAWRAVLPRRTALFPVGGITPQNMAGYRAAGADGFGLGSALYRAGDDADTVTRKARAFCVAWERAPA